MERVKIDMWLNRLRMRAVPDYITVHFRIAGLFYDSLGLWDDDTWESE